ncbi:DUF2088 domain-containing protein [Candidatus Atribacteria bacterium 1244-E10-H5-B2]|nr:MAG: DUF2088 domain-containing protein [Candidatus Atribacteria bacterium 1244-E10-H5-B2]
MGNKCLKCNTYKSILKNNLQSENIYKVPVTSSIKDLDVQINKSLKSPIGFSTLSIPPGSKVGLLFDDITRPTPTKIVLPAILDYLQKIGVKSKDIYLVHSPGLHISGRNELQQKVGNYYDWPRLIDHDARHSDMAFYGITSFGTPVWVNSIMKELDYFIGIGCIKPHMDAGFSGGYKIVLPGVAAKETIDQNHRLMLSPNSSIGCVEGNPVRQDIEEAGQLVGLNFIINFILNQNKQIVDLVAGDPIKAHRAGIEKFKKVLGTHIGKKIDITIACTCSEFMSKCLGALVRAQIITKSSGTIILVAPHLQKWAPFGNVKRFASFPEDYIYKSSETLANLIITNNLYEIRHGTAAFNFRSICETIKVILVSNNNYQSKAKKMNMGFANTLEQAFNLVRSTCKEKPETILLLNTEYIYPLI